MDYKALGLFLTVLLAASNLNTNESAEFDAFTAKFGMQFSAEEDSYRRAVYMSNMAIIEAHNADETQTYKMGENQFTAMTQDEFEATMLMPARQLEDGVVDSEMVGNVDWIAQGKVTGVKDQGSCGSCWAFSAVGPVESLNAIRGASLTKFSEQQLNSCDTSNGGCQGGLMDRALRYIASNGMCTEASYPYVSGNGSNPSCRISSCTKSSFTISGPSKISRTSSALQSAVASMPIAVAVAASNWSSYSSGIFSNCNTSLNHGVVLTGYTSSYWMIKNSWGSFWGESGYIRLAPGNTCGVLNDADSVVA